MDQFKALEDLVRKGKLTSDNVEVLGHKVSYRTLSFDQEVQVFAKSSGNLALQTLEQLTLSITSFDGVSISDNEEERNRLRTLLSSLNGSQIMELFKPYAELVSKVPKLTVENLKSPLAQDQQQEVSTNSAISVENFPTTP